jgi:hypothetical protein
VSTYFWWTLHASEHCASEGAQKFALTVKARIRANALSVEDQGDVALSIEDVLAVGCTVTGARTVAEAIELAAEADVPLVDVRLRMA